MRPEERDAVLREDAPRAQTPRAFSDPIGDGGGGVAYFAHIGGFLFGMLLIKLFANNVHEDYEAAHRMPVY